MVKEKSISDVVISVVSYSVVILLAVLCLVPILNTVAISFSNASAVNAGMVSFWPVGFTADAYKEMLKDQQFFRSFMNSVIRVLVGGSINMALVVITAFPLSRKIQQFPQKRKYMYFLIFTMMFSGGMVPSFLLINKLKLIDTIWALVLPGAVGVSNIILMKNFFESIPDELDEAARIDGASPLSTFTKVYLPLALPGLATITLFVVIGHWNAFFDGIIYINTASKMPLQTYIQQLTAVIRDDIQLSEEELEALARVSGKTFNAAKVFVTTLPILIVYPFLQRYFVTGLVMGSVKG